jgi:hypothetical protein
LVKDQSWANALFSGARLLDAALEISCYFKPQVEIYSK